MISKTLFYRFATLLLVASMLALSAPMTLVAHATGTLPSCTVVGWGNTWGAGAETPPAGLSGVTAITAGSFHGLALKSDGTVVGWGNTWGSGAETPPAGLSGVTAIAAGQFHSLALKSDGTVVGWGADYSGQATPPAGLSDVMAISAGTAHSLALKFDGTVVGWGANDSGEATPPAGLSDVVAISAGGSHSLALKSDGTVVGWGADYGGQATPPAGLSDVMAIAAGYQSSLALKSDGTVVSWGANDSGQAVPPAGLSGVVAIAVGEQHSLALKSDGTVVGWGNTWGAGAETPPVGLSGVTAIAAGTNYSLALQCTSAPTAPVANDDIFTFDASADPNWPTFMTDSSFLGNDSDPNGKIYSITYNNRLDTGPMCGAYEWSCTPFSYYIPGGWSGTDSFQYQYIDTMTSQLSNWATVIIIVKPVALDQSVTTNQETPLDVTLTTTGIPLTYTIVDQPAHGSLSGSGAAQTYTPAAGYSGADSFTFKANDGSSDSNVATVTITVNAVNQAPVCGADSFSTNENTSLYIDMPSLVNNDYDPDGEGLLLSNFTNPVYGSWDWDNNPWLYIPPAGWTGIDSFQYFVGDETHVSACTVTITVNAVNHAPVAQDQSVSINQDAAVSITLAATDTDNDALTYSIVAQPQHGALSGSGAALTYTPAAGYAGADSFTFKANDGEADSNVATVSITVNPAGYAFSGFFQPVDNLPAYNQINAGQGVPMKFSLGGNYGLNILASGYPVSHQIACDGGAPIDVIEQTTTANQGLTYDPVTGQYVYVWKTLKNWAGTCRQFTIRLSDGTDHIALFKFK